MYNNVLFYQPDTRYIVESLYANQFPEIMALLRACSSCFAS